MPRNFPFDGHATVLSPAARDRRIEAGLAQLRRDELMYDVMTPGRLLAELRDDSRCRDCGGLVNGDGLTTDPDHCCFYCKAD